LRFIDSYNSIKNIEFIEWVINIRGAYAKQAITFLEGNLRSGCLRASSIDSELGWLETTKEMFAHIKGGLIFYWVEDHIFVSDSKIFMEAMGEFELSGADWLSYSWFNTKYQTPYLTSGSLTLGKLINISHINKKTVSSISNANGGYCYVSSLTGIYTKSFFHIVINSTRPKILRWHHKTPFDFEKIWEDDLSSQVNIAIPKIELFASIDDDMGVEGYSLISRGIYPRRVSGDALKIQEGRLNNTVLKVKNFLKKGIFYTALSKTYISMRRIRYTVLYCFYKIYFLKL
jgi:hypothetical protein